MSESTSPRSNRLAIKNKIRSFKTTTHPENNRNYRPRDSSASSINEQEIDQTQFSDQSDQSNTRIHLNNDDLNKDQHRLRGKTIKNLVLHYETDSKTNDHLSNTTSLDLEKTNSQTNSFTNNRRTKGCILCFKSIDEADYVSHVEACLPPTPDEYHRTTANNRNKDSCLNCSSIVSPMDGSGILVSCPSRHVYCLSCIQDSLNKFIETGSVPVCHSMFCDYQLSRYDLSLIPLEEEKTQRLLALIQNNQRPQCPRCHFYVDLDLVADFNQHVENCDLENGIPCEYCHCEQSPFGFDEHVRQCRNDPTHRLQTFVDFIVPRTKYPFSAQQITFFIEMQKKNYKFISARFIVEALAQFDDVFPFELPNRECDTCAESCLYDDIFVFGCPDSHKICYKCYERSCRSQMNNNEILTCGICSYELSYGELNQLRVYPEERDQFVQYQVQKTFESYSNSNRGIIKCPNQNCKWAFEPANPKERFRVVCPMCSNEFCSLCSQPHHYRTECQQLAEVTQQWYFWCSTERQRYLEEKAKEDAAFKARLKEFNKQKSSMSSQNKELTRRYKELIADETYKEQNCRICPHCSRVVQHMGGCSLMVCGKDYHGGNNQSGCGQNFKWDQAKPYIAITNKKPEDILRDLLDPNHKLVEHKNIKCDGCQEPVYGIRFDCVHCSSLIYCEKCEQYMTALHADENQQQGKLQHVFRLITKPENGDAPIPIPTNSNSNSRIRDPPIPFPMQIRIPTNSNRFQFQF